MGRMASLVGHSAGRGCHEREDEKARKRENERTGNIE